MSEEIKTCKVKGCNKELWKDSDLCHKHFHNGKNHRKRKREREIERDTFYSQKREREEHYD